MNTKQTTITTLYEVGLHTVSESNLFTPPNLHEHMHHAFYDVAFDNNQRIIVLDWKTEKDTLIITLQITGSHQIGNVVRGLKKRLTTKINYVNQRNGTLWKPGYDLVQLVQPKLFQKRNHEKFIETEFRRIILKLITSEPAELDDFLREIDIQLFVKALNPYYNTPFMELLLSRVDLLAAALIEREIQPFRRCHLSEPCKHYLQFNIIKSYRDFHSQHSHSKTQVAG